MIAKGGVIVVAAAQRQGQGIGEAPFVLGEQGPLGELERGRCHAVGHLRIPVLTAQGEGVITPLRREFAVEDDALGFQITRTARAGHAVGNDPTDRFGLAPGQRVLQGPESQTPVVGQHSLIAVELQGVGIAARRRGGAQFAVGIIVPLACHIDVQPKVVIRMRCQAQTSAQIPYFAFGRTATEPPDRSLGSIDGLVSQFGIVAGQIAATHCQPQQVANDGPVGEDIAAIQIAELVVALKCRIGRDRPLPRIADLLGDDVDDTADGIGAIQGRDGSAHDLDALDRRYGRQEAGRGFAKPVRRYAAGRVLAPSVDQDQRVVRAQSTDVDGQATRLAHRRADINAWHIGEDFRDRASPTLTNLLAGDHTDRCRRLFDPLFEAGRRYDDIGDLRRRVRVIDDGLRGCRQRDCGDAGCQKSDGCNGMNEHDDL